MRWSSQRGKLKMNWVLLFHSLLLFIKVFLWRASVGKKNVFFTLVQSKNKSQTREFRGICIHLMMQEIWIKMQSISSWKWNFGMNLPSVLIRDCDLAGKWQPTKKKYFWKGGTEIERCRPLNLIIVFLWCVMSSQVIHFWTSFWMELKRTITWENIWRWTDRLKCQD